MTECFRLRCSSSRMSGVTCVGEERLVLVLMVEDRTGLKTPRESLLRSLLDSSWRQSGLRWRRERE